MNSSEATTTFSEMPAPQAAGRVMPRRSTQEYADAWNLCRKLGKELSVALRATGDMEYAIVMPAGYSRAGVGFGQLPDDSVVRVERPDEEIARVSSRIAIVLQDAPDIERVAIESRGIYTQVKLPDQTEDPLVKAIEAYREGLKAFNALPEDEDFRKNEDRYIAETYRTPERNLVENVLPTISLSGAKEAMRFAIDEADHIDPMARNALISALSYLEAM